MQSPDVTNRRKTTEFSRPKREELPLPPVPAPDNKSDISLLDPKLYINRELSLLSFQWRVLQEAFDESNPLLERFKFLAIVGTNLEEFFMVRVAGLKRQIESASLVSGPDGLSPSEQLDAIKSEVTNLIASAEQCLHNSLKQSLGDAGIHIRRYSSLDPDQKEQIDHYYLHHIFPVLTPLGFDPGHPFPHISNLSLNLAVTLRDANMRERFARVKIPDTLPQLVQIGESKVVDRQTGTPSKQLTYIWLDDLVRGNLESLFPGMTILEAHTFYIVRDAELEVQEWEAEDLLETTEEGVRQRRFGDVVQLQVHAKMPADMLQILVSNMQIDATDVYFVNWPRPLSCLKQIGSIDRHDLKFAPFVPVIAPELNPDLSDEDIFATVSRRNVLLHHPYDSFQPVVNFLKTAAADPNVLAIKTTLYRIGKNSPIVEALLSAMTNRKQVASLVELKARFDEESNIEWAKAMEREGVHVVYGLVGLKIHAKVALVVRKEGDTIKRYVHLSTGNYNPTTAHLYSDVGLLTCDEDLGADVTDLFNYLTGYSAKRDYRKLVVAPIDMRQRMQAWIKREIDNQREGKQGHIILKTNALVDEQIIRLLYEASQNDVKVDLLVRGVCCLRPGIAGVSENIRVTSVVGRFLEHSRIYYFNNGGNPQIYCGSADMMPRNLDRRVEVLFPIEDPDFARYLRQDVLETYLQDRVNAWTMQSDGTYRKLKPRENENCVSSQQWFMNQVSSVRDKPAYPASMPPVLD